MSESCSKDSALASILRNTDHGFFCRLLTSALMPCFSNSARQRLLDLADHALDCARTMSASRCGDGAVGFRVDVAEGQLLQLLAHVLHAHAPGERRIDLHRLLGNAQRACPSGTWSSVRILCSRSASLTSSTRTSSEIASSSLRRFSACSAFLETRSSFFSLVRPSTSLPISLPNSSSISCARGGGVLDRVVQQRDRDRRLVEMHVGQDRGDFERMREIGIAGGALLMAMLLHGIDIGLVEQRLVDVRLVALDALDKLVLTHHGRGSPAAANETCAAPDVTAHVNR